MPSGRHSNEVSAASIKPVPNLKSVLLTKRLPRWIYFASYGVCPPDREGAGVIFRLGEVPMFCDKMMFRARLPRRQE